MKAPTSPSLLSSVHQSSITIQEIHPVDPRSKWRVNGLFIQLVSYFLGVANVSSGGVVANERKRWKHSASLMRIVFFSRSLNYGWLHRFFSPTPEWSGPRPSTAENTGISFRSGVVTEESLLVQGNKCFRPNVEEKTNKKRRFVVLHFR